MIASVVLIVVSVNNPTLAIELFKNSDISEEKAFIFSKIFANKLPLFDFINSFCL